MHWWTGAVVTLFELDDRAKEVRTARARRVLRGTGCLDRKLLAARVNELGVRGVVVLRDEYYLRIQPEQEP